jgi:methylenetetrahydrofolate dehydrogenase (NADP+)/methenyltetrahydrofolate cyclohydrolase
MQLLDGKACAQAYKSKIAQQVLAETSKGIRKPHLAAILVGNDGASETYIASKVKTCAELGFESTLLRFDSSVSEAALLEAINEFNSNASVDGILVQLPLPNHVNSDTITLAIDPAKDVDGFHIANAGALMVGSPEFIPCTPYGCMKMLESINYPMTGAKAVIVGASNIVGKPMAMLLLLAGATITVCNSKTRNLSEHTKNADILVVATGKPKMITGDMVKQGAVVIDVGINRLPDGKLCGDVDFESAKEVAGFITPVPGGVGPMTITMLLMNTLEAAERE